MQIPPKLRPAFKRVKGFILHERKNRFRYLQKKRPQNFEMKIEECDKALAALENLEGLGFGAKDHIGQLRIFLGMELEMRIDRYNQATGNSYWRLKVIDNRHAVKALEEIADYWQHLRKTSELGK